MYFEVSKLLNWIFSFQLKDSFELSPSDKSTISCKYIFELLQIHFFFCWYRILPLINFEALKNNLFRPESSLSLKRLFNLILTLLKVLYSPRSLNDCFSDYISQTESLRESLQESKPSSIHGSASTPRGPSTPTSVTAATSSKTSTPKSLKKIKSQKS